MRVTIDEAAFEVAGLVFNRLSDQLAEIWFVDRPERVRVAVDAGELVFVPQRAASHRDVLQALGRPTP